MSAPDKASAQLHEHAIGMAHLANDQLNEVNQASREVNRIEGELADARSKATDSNENYLRTKKLADEAVQAAFGNPEEITDPATEEDLGFTLIGSDDKDASVRGSSMNDPKEALLARISKEAAVKIHAIGTALAEKYDLSPEDIGVVVTKEEPENGVGASKQKIVVVDMADKGLSNGSYNEIMHPADDSRYILEVDGKKYDTRSGMTWPVYEALWWNGEADAHMLGTSNTAVQEKINTWHKHFDTEQSDDTFYSATLLTGENLGWHESSIFKGKASFGRDSANRMHADRVFCFPDSTSEKRDISSHYELRFRPAVVIE